MSEAAIYVSPSELKNVAEQVDSIETDDFVDFAIIPVGNYLSQSRSIKVAKKEKYFSAEISFTNGIQDESGKSFGGGQYPIRTWVTSKKYEQDGKPGQTSSMAEYLKKVGYDVKQLPTNEDILDALEESQTLPVKVYIGWTNRTEKLDDGSYSKEFAKTKDFNVGSKEEPIYQPFFEKDGVKVLARHKVSGFKVV